MLSTEMKKRSEAAALGSLRAEGLKPSVKVQRQAQKYVRGKITKQELRSSVLREVKSKLKAA